jgi:hypothetical protein
VSYSRTVQLHGLWIFQSPDHDELADLKWEHVDIRRDGRRPDGGWTKLIVNDVVTEVSVDSAHRAFGTLAQAEWLQQVPGGTLRQASIRKYAFGVYTAIITFDVADSFSANDLKFVGTHFDASADSVDGWVHDALELSSALELVNMWLVCAVTTVAAPEAVLQLSSHMNDASRPQWLSGVDSVTNSLVGKLSIFNADSPKDLVEQLELLNRVHAYAAGMYRFERLMIRELVRLTARGRVRKKQLREAELLHNGVRMLRAMWAHQFIAAPLHLRAVLEQLWKSWNMELLVDGIAEMSDKISANLTSRRDERRNELTSRLNWIVLAAAIVQVVVAVIAIGL